jgi:hypothetical protein
VILGRPISSQASRRAVWKAVSERVSALPVGGEKWVEVSSSVGTWQGNRISKPQRAIVLDIVRLHK